MHRTLPQHVEAKFVADWVASGQPWDAFAASRGVERWRAYRWLHRAGHRLPRARVRPLREDAFDGRLTEEKAYFLGLMMADGSVNTSDPTRDPCVQFSQSTSDERGGGGDLVRRFAAFLGDEGWCRPGKDKHGNRNLNFQIRSLRLAKAMAKHGVLPKKSNRELAGSIVANSRHFWRGYVDGDGSPGRNRNTPKLEIVGSEMLLRQFLEFLRLSHIDTRHHHGTGQLMLYGRHAQDAGLLLYDGATVYLPRKYDEVMSWKGLDTKRPRRPKSPGP